jgi:hypothetical protein
MMKNPAFVLTICFPDHGLEDLLEHLRLAGLFGQDVQLREVFEQGAHSGITRRMWPLRAGQFDTAFQSFSPASSGSTKT